jgi:hypothetical protein
VWCSCCWKDDDIEEGVKSWNTDMISDRSLSVVEYCCCEEESYVEAADDMSGVEEEVTEEAGCWTRRSVAA